MELKLADLVAPPGPVLPLVDPVQDSVGAPLLLEHLLDPLPMGRLMVQRRVGSR